MIYCDMDGVLAKWNTSASLEDTYEPGYFREREADESALRLIRLLVEHGCPVTILSSAYVEGTARKDKRDWLIANGLGDLPYVFVPYGKPKGDYIEEKGVLLDDFSHNLHDWEQTPGMVGVKYYNGINGTKGSWTGYSVDHRMPPEKMYVVVSAVANSL